MRKVRLIAAHEFWTTVKRPGYLFVAFGLPLIMVGIFGLTIWLTHDTATSQIAERAKAGVVDEAGFLTLETPEGLVRPATRAEARAAVAAGRINTFVVLLPDYRATGNVEVHSKVKQTLLDAGQSGVPHNVTDYLTENLLAAVPDEQTRERLRDPTRVVKSGLLDERGEVSTEKPFDLARLGAAMGFFFAMFFSMSMGGTYLLQGLADEKENRVMEMVLTSVRPEELMWGKLVGLGAAGFLQLVIWAVMGVTGAVAFITNLVLDPMPVLVAVPLFILGYLLMGSLMLGTGSLGSNLREVTQWSMVWSLMSVLPFFVLQPILLEPAGALARGLTFFPLTTASMLSLRYILDPQGLPAWEMAAGYAILIVSTVLSVKAAARIYKVGLLMYGKRPTPRQIFRWLFR